MKFKPAASVIFAVGLILLNHGCAFVGPTTGTDHAIVTGGTATVTISPSVKIDVPVNVAIGDKVAEAAANAAVGYLKRLPVAITALSQTEAIQQGVGAGLKKAIEIGQPVDQEQLHSFVQTVVREVASKI